MKLKIISDSEKSWAMRERTDFAGNAVRPERVFFSAAENIPHRKGILGIGVPASTKNMEMEVQWRYKNIFHTNYFFTYVSPIEVI